MNYIDMCNQFWIVNKECCFKPSEISLYFHLLDVSNSLGWKNPFKQSNLVICATIGISEPIIQRSREKLVKAGLVTFKSGTKKGELTEYKLHNLGIKKLYLNKHQSNTQSDTQTVVEVDTQAGDIYKQEETKPEEDRQPEKLMIEFRLEDCKLPVDSIGYRVIEAAVKLYQGFLVIQPNNRDLPFKTVKEWIPPVRKLIEKKRYTYEQVSEVLNWVFDSGDFWASSIIDTESLEKHFEKIKRKYQDGKK